jgi:hypothetical protein
VGALVVTDTFPVVKDAWIMRSCVGTKTTAALLVMSPSLRALEAFHALFSGRDFQLVCAMGRTICDRSSDREIGRQVDAFRVSPLMSGMTA